MFTSNFDVLVTVFLRPQNLNHKTQREMAYVFVYWQLFLVTGKNMDWLWHNSSIRYAVRLSFCLLFQYEIFHWPLRNNRGTYTGDGLRIMVWHPSPVSNARICKENTRAWTCWTFLLIAQHVMDRFLEKGERINGFVSIINA